MPRRDLAKELDAARTGGAPLPRPARSELEHGLGADLAAVRLHRGARADALAEALGATALTSGADVFLHRSAPEPSTRAGRDLLTHEVFHVLQQRAGPVEGTQGPDGLQVSHPADRHERAAAAAAEQLRRGGRVDLGAGAPAPARSRPAVQRQTPEMVTAAGSVAPVALAAARPVLLEWTALLPSQIAALIAEGNVAVAGTALGPGTVATATATVATEATLVTGPAVTAGTITVGGLTVAEGTLISAEAALVTGTLAVAPEAAAAVTTTGAVGGALLVSNPVGWIVLGVIVVVGVGVAAGVAVYLITRPAPYDALSVEPVKGSMAPVRRPPPAPVATGPATRGTGKGSMAPIAEPLEAPGAPGGAPVREPETPAPATAPAKGGMAPVREPEAVSPAVAPGADEAAEPLQAAFPAETAAALAAKIKPLRPDGKVLSDYDVRQIVNVLGKSPDGPAIAAYILAGAFDACAGYFQILSNCKAAGMLPSTLMALERGEQILADDPAATLRFEDKDPRPPPDYHDVDLGVVSPSGEYSTIWQFGSPLGSGKVAANAHGGGAQLENVRADRRVVELRVRPKGEPEKRGGTLVTDDGSSTFFDVYGFDRGLEEWKDRYPDVELHIIFANGQVRRY